LPFSIHRIDCPGKEAIKWVSVCLLRLKYTEMHLQLGLHPETLWGAYSTPRAPLHHPIAGFCERGGERGNGEKRKGGKRKAVEEW